MEKFKKDDKIFFAEKYDGRLDSVILLRIPECSQDFLSDDLEISTPSGYLKVEKGQWVLRDIEGQFSVVSDADLKESYTPDL